MRAQTHAKSARPQRSGLLCARGFATVHDVSARRRNQHERSWPRVIACAVALVAFACGHTLTRARPSRGSVSHAAAIDLQPAPTHAVAQVAPAAQAPPPPAASANTSDTGAAQDATSDGTRASELAAEAPLGGPTPIEDPGGHALDALHAALRRVQEQHAQAHLVFYGASHVASDLFTGALRQRLQKRFGEAGPGFVVPGRPWRWYRNAGIHIEQSRGFSPLRVIERAPVPAIYGLAGAAMDSSKKRSGILSIATRGNGGLHGYVSRAELYYLKQPGGGHLTVFIDGKRMARIASAARAPEPGYAHFDLSDGPHRFELRTTTDGAVRVFGWALERDEPGVILDTLGVPGTRVRDHLFWDDAFYREHLARRQPDLVVLAYGTNESGDDDVPLEHYEAKLREVIARVHEVAPAASCVLIGPSDRPVRNDDGTFAPRPLTERIAQVQRTVSAELGCGFFDLQRFMGGPMSMVRWVAADPPLGTKDYVHFTAAGYERLASVLYDDLLAGFEDAEAPAVAAAPAPRPEDEGAGEE